ncbi:D-glycerate dehydrogenase [Synergistales bacterium]|nr:D-glycerate dehydrogenase [Synergistales bacterium]
MSLPKVYVGFSIQEAGIAVLRGNVDFEIWEGNSAPPRDLLLKKLSEADGFLAWRSKVNGELLDSAPNLKIVSNYGVGYDSIDVAAASKRGVCVTNTPGVLTEATADLGFSLILASARRLMEANAYLRSGEWNIWDPELMVGVDVFGATIGIVGLGQIGQAVARRAKGFGMSVLYSGNNRKPEAEAESGAKYVPLDELLRVSDFVSLHCPLNDATRGLIGERELKMMKKTAILINIARGAVVDQGALFRACSEKWILGAGLDVFEREPVPLDEPLLNLRNVTTLPHIGSASRASRDGMAVCAASNLVAALQGRRPQNLVNPEVWRASDAGKGR